MRFPTVLATCAASIALCWLGAAVGPRLIERETEKSLPQRLAQIDGRWYASIVDGGYDYSPFEKTNVAFFPAFPFLAKLTQFATGVSTEWALVLTANGLMLAAAATFGAYARSRLDAAPDAPQGASTWASLIFLLLPPTFFFRLGYSESTFLLGAVLVLYGIERRWPVALVAFLAGAVTATRPVGVALVPVVLLYAAGSSSGSSAVRRVGRCLWVAPVSCWGLIVFCAFQYVQFDEPFAFAHAQASWQMRKPLAWPQKLLAYLSWEPIRSVYDSQSIAYWVDDYFPVNAVLSLQFANPIYFLAFSGATVWGAAQGWLNRYEFVAAAGLLAIPYATRGYDMMMNSQARFAAVVFPVYLVLGRGLAVLPRSVAATICLVSAAWMVVYAGMFAADLRYF